jgi:uncharacterized protein (DUF3820 family)
MLEQNPEDFYSLVETQMPYGKYMGVALIDLPEPYVVWYFNNGLPKGKLGRLLALLYEIKANGLEYLFDPFRESSNGSTPSIPTTPLSAQLVDK